MAAHPLGVLWLVLVLATDKARLLPHPLRLPFSSWINRSSILTSYTNKFSTIVISITLPFLTWLRSIAVSQFSCLQRPDNEMDVKVIHSIKSQ